MNIRLKSENEVADLAANLATLLAGTALSAIDSHVRADLVTALGTKPADLIAQTAAAATVDQEKRSAFAAKDILFEEIVQWVGRVRDALRSGLAEKDQFLLAGLDFPVTRAKRYLARDPTEMSVSGTSNGVNTGVFSGNNRSGSVMYEIWRREGDEGQWHQHLLTKRQRFTDTGITPGQYYEYRVRAVAAQTVSNFSNSAVVYGVL
jgi:hypothetical protein